MVKISLLLFMSVVSIARASSLMTYEMKQNSYAQETDSTKYKYKQNQTFSFASYYGDHMVLQSSPQMAVIWGYAPLSGTNEIVMMEVVGATKQTQTAKVGEDGKWVIMLDPIGRGGPYRITATLQSKTMLRSIPWLLSNKITLEDVLFGDVWVCSGQSNMQFSIAQVFNASAEIADAVNYPQIRLFMVKDETSDTPLDDLSKDGVYLPWSRPSPETLGPGEFRGFSAVCWLYGKYLYDSLRVPIGLVETSWGGTPVEAWSSPDVLKKCGITENIKSEPRYIDVQAGDDDVSGPHNNSVLWNAMVHPLLKMTIYGAIWYQGEANVNAHMDLYNCTFPGMISDWRRKFHASGGTSSLFPFGFVQLAGNTPDHTLATGFPDIRWHQTADYGYVPNHRLRSVFMAVAMDLPDFTSPYGTIHPRDKQDVARRLVQSGLAVAYNQNISYHGPYPVMVEVASGCDPKFKEDMACLFFDYAMEIEMRSFDGFEVCCAFTEPPVCETGKSWWIPITAAALGNRTSHYSLSCLAENIMGVRYAWRVSPCPFQKCGIYGLENKLPMPPFSYSNERFVKTRVGDDYIAVFKPHRQYSPLT